MVGTTVLTITPAAVTSIALTPASPSVAEGLTQQFTATGTYTDGSTADLSHTVTWTSSDLAVATIAATGLATSLTAGDTTIEAAYDGVTSTATLDVTAAALVSIAVSPANPSVAKGLTEQFTRPAPTPTARRQTLTPRSTWTSANTRSRPSPASGLASTLATGSSIDHRHDGHR